MNQRPYTKLATTYARQVEILRERGMTVEDPAQAEFYLRRFVRLKTSPP